MSALVNEGFGIGESTARAGRQWHGLAWVGGWHTACSGALLSTHCPAKSPANLKPPSPTSLPAAPQRRPLLLSLVPSAGTKMERLTQLNAQLAASITWIEEARRTLQKAADLAASQAAEEEEEDGQGEGAAGAGGGSTSAMEVDWQGTAEEVSGAPSAQAASAGPSQGTTPEPDPLTAALMAAAEAEAEAEGGAGRRGGGATPPLHPLQPVVKPKKRGRQARTKQNEHASGLPELKVGRVWFSCGLVGGVIRGRVVFQH